MGGNHPMTTESIKAAVEWWADKLKACKQSGLSAAERKDPGNRGYELAEMLMSMNKPAVTDDQIAKFSESLTAQIAEGNIHHLGVDYGPDVPLFGALKAAGIRADMGTLPIKTSMWLDADRVSVRYGYGSAEETIWAAEKEGA